MSEGESSRLAQANPGHAFVDDLLNGEMVNHILSIASLNSTARDNEENYLIKELFSTSLGRGIENQGRV